VKTIDHSVYPVSAAGAGGTAENLKVNKAPH
jgi:hypothetical protein